jgi:hypothetical protein
MIKSPSSIGFIIGIILPSIIIGDNIDIVNSLILRFLIVPIFLFVGVLISDIVNEKKLYNQFSKTDLIIANVVPFVIIGFILTTNIKFWSIFLPLHFFVAFFCILGVYTELEKRFVSIETNLLTVSAFSFSITAYIICSTTYLLEFSLRWLFVGF